MRLAHMLLMAFSFSACKTANTASLEEAAQSAKAVKTTPIEAPETSRDKYAKPHYGFYFLGPGDQTARAVPGERNPFFDPTRPTLIYFHGWSPGEMSKDEPRSFNKHKRFPSAPDLDLVKAWADLGWNVGMMDWTQFADTSFETGTVGIIPTKFSYDTVERRVWGHDDHGELVYYLSDGSRHVSTEASVADMFANEYVAFMNSVAKSGPEVRFFGHSLGTQMAMTVAYRVFHMGTTAAPINPAILPVRISLTDITATNCPKAWLPSTTIRNRGANPECVGKNGPGDWVSERLGDAVNFLQNTSQRVAFDAYRCWAVSSSGILADQVKPLLERMAFTEMKPNTGAADLFTKHAFCMWNYLASVALPPPLVDGDVSASAVHPADIPPANCNELGVAGVDKARAVSASASTERVRQLMNGAVYFVQTKESVGPSNTPYSVTCKSK